MKIALYKIQDLLLPDDEALRREAYGSELKIRIVNCNIRTDIRIFTHAIFEADRMEWNVC